MNVSVIVRTHNDGRVLEECLKQIFAQDFPGGKEFILIDEASQDATLEIVKRFPFDHVIRLDRFLSGSHTLNTAVRICRGGYVIQTLGHTIPSDHQTFHRLLLGLQNKEIAAVCGRQLPHPMGDPFKNVESQTGYEDVSKEIPFVSNSFVAVRRDVWQRIPYDESYLSAEDKVWSLQVRESGLRFFYEPRAVVLHYHTLNLGNVFRKAYRNARTHRRIGFSKKNVFFRIDQRIATDLRYLEKKRYILLSPIYRGLQAAGYAAGWYLR